MTGISLTYSLEFFFFFMRFCNAKITYIDFSLLTIKHNFSYRLLWIMIDTSGLHKQLAQSPENKIQCKKCLDWVKIQTPPCQGWTKSLSGSSEIHSPWFHHHATREKLQAVWVWSVLGLNKHVSDWWDERGVI